MMFYQTFLPNDALPSEAEREILTLVHRSHRISKAEIVRQSSFSQTHVYLLLDALVSRQFLKFHPGEIYKPRIDVIQTVPGL